MMRGMNGMTNNLGGMGGDGETVPLSALARKLPRSLYNAFRSPYVLSATQ